MQRIALIGDYNSTVVAHQAIPQAVAIAARSLQMPVQVDWLATERLAQANPSELKQYQAFWCTPGSPYQNMDGALFAIQFAREHRRPFLGTCAGFQHALIEYARHVLGYQQADHAESHPTAPMPLIAALSCSLVEQQGEIFFEPHSQMARFFQTSQTLETYHCNYGLNPQYRSFLEQAGVVFSGTDSNGEVRAFELTSHPFFIGTLFQPERSALQNQGHPLIRTFVQAIIDTK